MNDQSLYPFSFILHEVARLFRARVEERAGVHGLSEAQLRLLARLWKEEGATQIRLAQLLEVEPISISRLLDRMEQGGWIERRQDPRDRRVRLIHTTEKTKAVRNEVQDVASQVQEEALKGMPENIRNALFEGLYIIGRNLSLNPELSPCFGADFPIDGKWASAEEKGQPDLDMPEAGTEIKRKEVVLS